MSRYSSWPRVDGRTPGRGRSTATMKKL
uniref:Uncharacterized protein n=1 Tax=Arundo donax TaxID=35708 RepID=A0A0A9C4W9_ARUDO